MRGATKEYARLSSLNLLPPILPISLIRPMSPTLLLHLTSIPSHPPFPLRRQDQGKPQSRGASRFHAHRNPNRIRHAVVNRRSISPASIFCRFLVAISDRAASSLCVKPLRKRSRRTFPPNARILVHSFFLTGIFRCVPCSSPTGPARTRTRKRKRRWASQSKQR
jgi:hypothetical protein